ncbi:MAG: acetate--CoA ligase family protein [Deltaproteobacteria bacterium]|nr:acetate--CoA ligase family protein [Deltaproteobacteria bacterium]
MKDDWKADLQPLFNPRSVALIGASESSPRSRAIFHNLREFGYRGKIFPVHPKRNEVFGLRCYPKVTDIPEIVDAFIIAIPRDFVVPVLEECAQKGVQAGVIVSAGFAEASEEGGVLQNRITKIAEAAKMRICGPNCFGVANIHERVALISGADVRHLQPGKIGIVFQSGGLLNLILLAAWDRGWGVSYTISCGNEAVVHVAHYAEYLVRDSRTEVVGILTEGIKDPHRFLAVARLGVDLGKPIIVLKIGKSEKGTKAAQAHTGALVGSDAVYDAVFRQNGVVRVDDLDDFIETVELFSKRKKLKGERLGFIAPSGAECGLIADIAADVGIHLPELSAKTAERLRSVQSPFLTIRNPLNAPEQYTRKAEIFKECTDALLDDDNLDILGFRLPLPRLREDKDVVDRFGDLVQAGQETDKLLIVFSRASVSLPEYWRQLLRQHEIPFLLEYRKGFKALKALMNYDRFLEREREPLDSQVRPDVDLTKIKNLLQSSEQTLTERQSKQILAAYGISIAAEALATSAEEAVRIARRIGYPVVLKIESPQIAHKTDARAVEMNISSDAEVRACYGRIIKNAKAYNPASEINGVLVQEMVPGGKEVIIGMTQDPQWGPAIVFGLGGIFVEIINDIAIRTVPLTRHDISEMFNEVKGFRILTGIRGEPEADTDALVQILLRFSGLAMDLRDHVSEIDINPLMVFEKGKGAKVVDCLMTRKL